MNAKSEKYKAETLQEKINTYIQNNTFNANSINIDELQTLPKPMDLQKKYYSVKSVKKKNVPKMTFENKIINFRNNLQLRKIDWRDAYCKLEVSRENILEESIKKFKLIDPLKVKILSNFLLILGIKNKFLGRNIS
jgi:hypothetical protein